MASARGTAATRSSNEEAEMGAVGYVASVGALAAVALFMVSTRVSRV